MQSNLTWRGILLPKNNLVKMAMTQAGTQHNTKAKTTLNQERKLISRISFEVTDSLLFVRRLCVAPYHVPESSAKRFCSRIFPQLVEGSRLSKLHSRELYQDVDSYKCPVRSKKNTRFSLRKIQIIAELYARREAWRVGGAP